MLPPVAPTRGRAPFISPRWSLPGSNPSSRSLFPGQDMSHEQTCSHRLTFDLHLGPAPANNQEELLFLIVGDYVASQLIIGRS